MTKTQALLLWVSTCPNKKDTYSLKHLCPLIGWEIDLNRLQISNQSGQGLRRIHQHIQPCQINIIMTRGVCVCVCV